MKIRWSVPAAEDLERRCEWIERDNPEAAMRVATIIYAGCSQLEDFPNMGGKAAYPDAACFLFRHCLMLLSIR